MKAIKLAGIRLINYVNDGINWKDHKDIVLDFWIGNKCRDFGYNPKSFADMFYTDELPTDVRDIYEKWFNSYDFLNDDDDWIEFIDGTLNLFYRTSNPTIMPDDTWYVMLFKSELEAKEICEEQIFHGNPNINSFWKLNTTTKSEEVGGRRNGFLFSQELDAIKPKDTRNFYWAITFQCIESVKLFYKTKKEIKSKCINWAADCEHMTLMKITHSGRFLVQQTFVEGKAWRDDRLVPQANAPRTPLSGRTLLKYIKKNYESMYGVWDEIDAIKKDTQEASNHRKNAVNVMNDEEIKIGKVIPTTINRFIANGNVSRARRERNKEVRQAIREKNRLREKEVKKKMRELLKEKGKLDRRQRNKLNPNPFISKGSGANL